MVDHLIDQEHTFCNFSCQRPSNVNKTCTPVNEIRSTYVILTVALATAEPIQGKNLRMSKNNSKATTERRLLIEKISPPTVYHVSNILNLIGIRSLQQNKKITAGHIVGVLALGLGRRGLGVVARFEIDEVLAEVFADAERVISVEIAKPRPLELLDERLDEQGQRAVVDVDRQHGATTRTHAVGRAGRLLLVRQIRGAGRADGQGILWVVELAALLGDEGGHVFFFIVRVGEKFS